MIESWRMKWAGHATCMEEMRKAYIFWSENLKGRHHLEELGIDRR
jgi:hypothetical protein